EVVGRPRGTVDAVPEPRGVVEPLRLHRVVEDAPRGDPNEIGAVVVDVRRLRRLLRACRCQGGEARRRQAETCESGARSDALARYHRESSKWSDREGRNDLYGTHDGVGLVRTILRSRAARRDRGAPLGPSGAPDSLANAIASR